MVTDVNEEAGSQNSCVQETCAEFRDLDSDGTVTDDRLLTPWGSRRFGPLNRFARTEINLAEAT